MSHTPVAPAPWAPAYRDAIARPLIGIVHGQVSIFLLEKLVEFVCDLIREQQHGAARVNALHVRPDDAFRSFPLHRSNTFSASAFFACGVRAGQRTPQACPDTASTSWRAARRIATLWRQLRLTGRITSTESG